jgi:hypothetical protein
MRSPRALTLLVFTVIAACISAAALTAADPAFDMLFGESVRHMPNAR